MWRIQGSVDPATPRAAISVIQLRQLKLERLPIGVQDEVNDLLEILQFRAERDAVRRIAPVGLEEFYAVPGFIRFAK